MTIDHFNNKSKEIIFISLVGGASIIAGFSSSISAIRKKNPDTFSNGHGPIESGEKLALRALGRATLITGFGFACFCYLAWKAANVSNGLELRSKLRKYIPEAKKNTKSENEAKISTFSQLMDYILAGDSNNKSEK